MAEWFYVENGAQAGPISAQELQHKVTAGLLPPDSLVWTETLPEWTPFSAIPELQPTPTAPPPAAAPVAPTPVAPAPAPTPAAAPQPMSSMAPQADATETNPELAPDQIGRIHVGEAMSQGWQIFRQNLGPAIIIFAVFMAAMFLLNAVAVVLNLFTLILGSVLMLLCQGYLLVGLWRAAINFADNQTPSSATLFPESKHFLMPAVANLVFALISGAVMIVAMIPFGIVSVLIGVMLGGSGTEPDFESDPTLAILISLPIIVGVLVALLLCTLLMLWPALVADRDYPPVNAIFASFKYTWPSAGSFFMLMFALGIIYFLGLLCLIVGVIPAGAYAMCTLGVAYRQLIPAAHRAA